MTPFRYSLSLYLFFYEIAYFPGMEIRGWSQIFVAIPVTIHREIGVTPADTQDMIFATFQLIAMFHLGILKALITPSATFPILQSARKHA